MRAARARCVDAVAGWCDGGRRLGPCRGALGARVERPGQPAAASRPARACATCRLSRSGELALDLSLSVSRTDNARRVRDGYISLSACGHPRALATHAEGPICTTNVLANDCACTRIPPRNFHGKQGVCGGLPPGRSPSLRRRVVIGLCDRGFVRCCCPAGEQVEYLAWLRAGFGGVGEHGQSGGRRRGRSSTGMSTLRILTPAPSEHQHGPVALASHMEPWRARWRPRQALADGALMEPRGRNRWQSAANRRVAEAAETSQNRCRRLRPVA
jgi:hypothetical protein